MPAKLTLYPLGRVPRFVLLRDGESFDIGRNPACGLLLEDSRVSKQHARLLWTGRDWTLEDLQTKNGTTVNGRALIEVTALKDGDWVSFGGLPARFERLTATQAAGLDSERLARIQTSAEMRRRLTASLQPLDLLGRLVDLTLQVTGAERGFLLTLGPTGELRPDVVVGFFANDLGREEFRGSVGAVKKVVESGQPLIVSDALADPSFRDRPSVISEGIRFLACLPLRDAGSSGQLIGLIYVDRVTPGDSPTVLDMETIETLANHTALLLAECLRRKGRRWSENHNELLAGLLRQRLEELLPTA